MRKLACVAVFLGACIDSGADDGGGGAVCGDGVCEAGESSFTCPGDCTAATCDPAVATSCGGDTICISQQCVPAFGRNYIFTVASATFPQFDETGTAWDAAGGLPDGFVRLTINGAAFRTGTVQDNLHPIWNSPTAHSCTGTQTPMATWGSRWVTARSFQLRSIAGSARPALGTSPTISAGLQHPGEQQSRCTVTPKS